MNTNKIIGDLILHIIREYVKTTHYKAYHDDLVTREGRRLNLSVFTSWMYANYQEVLSDFGAHASSAVPQMSQLFHKLKPAVQPVNHVRKNDDICYWWFIKNKTR